MPRAHAQSEATEFTVQHFSERAGGHYSAYACARKSKPTLRSHFCSTLCKSASFNLKLAPLLAV